MDYLSLSLSYLCLSFIFLSSIAITANHQLPIVLAWLVPLAGIATSSSRDMLHNRSQLVQLPSHTVRA